MQALLNLSGLLSQYHCKFWSIESLYSINWEILCSFKKIEQLLKTCYIFIFYNFLATFQWITARHSKEVMWISWKLHMQDHCIISPLFRSSLAKYRGEKNSKCFYFNHINIKGSSKEKTHGALFYIVWSYTNTHYLRKYLEQAILCVSGKIDPI